MNCGDHMRRDIQNTYGEEGFAMKEYRVESGEREDTTDLTSDDE